MSSRCNRIARGLQVAAVVLGAVLTHRAEAAPVMKVCVDQTNPTSAMDTRVVRAAARARGYAVEEVFFIGHGKGADDGFPVSCFARMAQSQCQLIMGFPVDISDPHLPPGVAATSAYASTGFVLVGRGPATPSALGDLPSGSEVGIAHLDTWAGLLFSTHPNIVMHVYPDDADMLTDLRHHRITAGMAWQPFIESYESGHARTLQSRMLSGKHMVWNLVALYAPDSQDAAEIFSKGVDALRGSGALDHLIRPYQAAATSASNSAALTSIAARRANQCSGHSPKVSAPRAKRAKPPALYTEAQAAKGVIAYAQNCAMCHGPLLDGQVGGYPGPALKGADFADPSYDFHVSDIFRFVAKLMPATAPGTLTNEQNVEIMAYLLQQNGYPAGTTELTYDGATRSMVPIRYYGK